MRISEGPLLPVAEDPLEMREATEEILREQARAINSNAGSAEIVESVAELPDPSEVQGRWYYVLGEDFVAFAYTNALGNPDWLVVKAQPELQVESYRLSADVPRTAGGWTQLLFDTVSSAGFYDTGTGIYTAPALVRSISATVQTQWEIDASNNNVIGRGVRIAGLSGTPVYPMAFDEYVSRGVHNFCFAVNSGTVKINAGDQFQIETQLTGTVNSASVQAQVSPTEIYTYLRILTEYYEEVATA